MNTRLSLTLGCSALLACSSAFAFTHTPYIGAGGGPDYGSWVFGSNIISDPAYRKYVTLKGWQWTVFGGYQLTFEDRYQLAAEVFGGNVNSKSVIQATALGPNNITQSQGDNIGVAFVPGVLVHEQSIFAKVGAEWSIEDYHTNSPSISPIPPATLTPSSYNTHERRSGYIIGTGITAPLTSILSVRTEYDYSSYGTMNLTSNISTNTATAYVKPRQDTYWVSLILHRPTKQDDSTPAPKTGFLLGAGGGVDVFRAEEDAGSSTRQEGGRGYNIRGIAGYSFNLSRYFTNTLAATASQSTSKNLNVDLDASAFSYKFRLRDLYSFRDQFGYKTSSHNLVYLLGGAGLAKFTKTSTPQAELASGSDFSHYEWGWLLGFGDQLALTKHVSYAIEGDYYRGFKSFYGSGTTNTLNFLSPKLMRVSANLIYTF